MLCSHTLAEFKEKTAQVLQAGTCTEVNSVFKEWRKTLDLHRI
jgi:hypothetical protein